MIILKSRRNHKTLRHLNRYREVLSVLLKYGFQDLISSRQYRDMAARDKKSVAEEGKKHKHGYTHWERVRMALEELGPTYIKVGQIMSNRPDLLTEGLIRELEKLQRRVAPYPAKEARRIIEEDLGKPVGELYRTFDNEPIASASIAQVHRATLFSGEEVVVKVRRPRIEETINTDIEILIRIAGIFERLFLKSQALDPVAIIKEIGKSLNREINFVNEAMNIEKFAANFKGTPSLVVPAVYRDLTSRRVITMEYIDGTHVAELEILKSKSLDTKAIADEGTKLVLEQIFEHGFFHADPHPGNVMVLDDGRICFLDFGMMGYVLPKHRNYLSTIMMGIIQQDYENITRALVEFAGAERLDNLDDLEYEIFVLVESYAHLPLKDLNMGEVLPKIVSVILDYNLSLPAGIFMLSKAIITIEGVGRKLDPDYDMVSRIEPFAKQMIKRRLKPDRLKKEFVSAAVDLHDLLKSLPEDTKRIINVLKSGRIKIDFDQGGLFNLFRRFSTITNRLTLSIIFASFVMGAGLLFNANPPPMWRGYPILGLIGVAGAAVSGLWLLVAIIRKPKQ